MSGYLVNSVSPNVLFPPWEIALLFWKIYTGSIAVVETGENEGSCQNSPAANFIGNNTTFEFCVSYIGDGE